MPGLLLDPGLSPIEGLQQRRPFLSFKGLAPWGRPTPPSAAGWTPAADGLPESAHPALQQVAVWAAVLSLCSSRSLLLLGLSGRQLGVPASAGLVL